jgi:hypothetical protein
MESKRKVKKKMQCSRLIGSAILPIYITLIFHCNTLPSLPTYHPPTHPNLFPNIYATKPIYLTDLHTLYRAILPARCLFALLSLSLDVTLPRLCSISCPSLCNSLASSSPPSRALFIRLGVPPKLTNTAGLSAVSASRTSSSAALNHLGSSQTRSGMSAVMSTGKPIAAMVCEMATVAATATSWIVINRRILRRGMSRRGLLREMKRGSERRKRALLRMPLDSMEPHCVMSV